MSESSTKSVIAGAISRVIVSLIIGTVVVVVAIAAMLRFAPSWIDMLLGRQEKIDSGSVTLVQLQKTAELKAATGTFSVPVFYTVEKTSKLANVLPDILAGEQVVAIYEGSVDATIDLRNLTDGDISVNKDTNTLSMTVPSPVLSTPRIHHDKSKVVAHNRGLLKRLDDALNDTPLEVRGKLDTEAVEALSKASSESDLQRMAESNGKEFFASLGSSLGFDAVEVTYKK